MSSTHFKYFLAGVAGIAVIAIGTYSYVTKQPTTSLDLNKTAADSKQSRNIDLSSDKSSSAAGKDAGKIGLGGAIGGSAKPNTPPLGSGAGVKPATSTPPAPAKTEPPKVETPPPAKRPTPDLDGPTSPKSGDSTASPPITGDTIRTPADTAIAGSNSTKGATETTPGSTGESKLPPISGGSPTASPPKPATTSDPGISSEKPRTTPDKPVVPDAKPGDSTKSASGDPSRGSTPPSTAGETLKPSAGEKSTIATPPATDGNKPAGRKVIRDSEIVRPGGPASPTGAKPAADSGTRTTPGASAATSYTVAQGDTLSKIAAEHFGDESKWDLIKKANPTIDENKLKVGTKLNLPPKADGTTVAAKPDAAKTANDTLSGRPPAGPTAKPEKPTPAAGSLTHKVTSGETLRKIARKELNDENRWREIYELNRDKLKSPDALDEGVVLTLPPVKKGEPPKKEESPKKTT
jgi:nucleoid-associated protein YgaU